MTISDSDSASPLEPPSLWTAKRARASYPALEGDHTADVAIVGGGIVGLTTALLLQDAGLEVVVLEARGIGRQVTGRSTAKVTSQHGLKYRTLRSAYGVEGAAVYARANQGAITSIRRIAEDLGIDCHFEPATAYAFARDEEMLPALHEEVDAAREAGLPARFTSTVDLPYEASGAVVFDEQAQFDPYAYLEGLARAVADRGGGRGTIFEGTVVTGVDDGSPCRVVTEAGSVTARDVVVATHIPMLDRGLYFARTKPRAHAVIAARLDGPRLDGMFISIDSPTRSFRSFEDEQGSWLIMLGETYTPGTADTEAMFRELEAEARDRFPIRSVNYRWTNEDLDSADGLPLVGPVLPTSDHVFVATGFSAWGITNGTVAARVVADRILGATSPVAELFDTSRFTPSASARIVASEVTETVKGLGKRAMPSERVDLQALRPGEGVVGELHGERAAVSRDEDGTLNAVSAVCTHLGCVVGWNGAMKTWDCPCHGSSFARDGTVLHGPAVVPLSTLRIED